MEKKRTFFRKICGMMIKREAGELLPGFVLINIVGNKFFDFGGRCGFILFTCGAEGGKDIRLQIEWKPNIGFAVIFLLAFILSAHSYTSFP